jgi:lipoprotein-releasing system ATP-binding protein
MTLVAEHITKEFPTREGALRVLDDVSFELAPGESLAVVGPSGSGKSTLLNILGTLERSTSGRVLLDNVDLAELDEARLAAVRNERIGFVFQEHHLLPQCTVLENVLVPTLAQGRAAAEKVARAEMLLERVGLAARKDHRPAEISGGERQRAAIARALIHGPLLLLADEPTGNLDAHAGAAVGELLLEMQRQEGAVLVVVTHSDRLAQAMNRRMDISAK